MINYKINKLYSSWPRFWMRIAGISGFRKLGIRYCRLGGSSVQRANLPFRHESTRIYRIRCDYPATLI